MNAEPRSAVSQGAEGRAIWVRRVTVEQLGGEGVATSCHELGLNLILPQVPWLSGPTRNRRYWDACMRPMTRKASDLGLEVHPWIFFLDSGSIDDDESLMQVHEDGNLDARLGCPASPEVVTRNLEKETEILDEFEVQGLSLEDCFVYHTWKVETEVCFCSYCKQNAPVDIVERKSWLRRQLSNMLGEVRRVAKRANPKIAISAAARSPYEGHSLVMSADWKEWCRLGYLEFLAPMIYTKDAGNFEGRVKEAVAIGHECSTPVYTGIGAHWDTAFTTPAELVSQIGLARKLGSDGIVFFHLGGMSEEQRQLTKRAFETRAGPVYRGT